MTWDQYMQKYYPNLKQDGWQRRKVMRAEMKYRHYSKEVREYLQGLKKERYDEALQGEKK